jgi:hypothetical protein
MAAAGRHRRQQRVFVVLLTSFFGLQNALATTVVALLFCIHSQQWGDNDSAPLLAVAANILSAIVPSL